MGGREEEGEEARGWERKGEDEGNERNGRNEGDGRNESNEGNEGNERSEWQVIYGVLGVEERLLDRRGWGLLVGSGGRWWGCGVLSGGGGCWGSGGGAFGRVGLWWSDALCIECFDGVVELTVVFSRVDVERDFEVVAHLDVELAEVVVTEDGEGDPGGELAGVLFDDVVAC